MKSILLALTIGLSTITATAQTAKPGEICSNLPDATGLTSCEKLAIDGLQTKQQLISSQYQSLLKQSQEVSNQLQSVISMVETKSPGMKYHPPDESHPQGQLLPVKPAAAPKK